MDLLNWKNPVSGGCWQVARDINQSFRTPSKDYKCLCRLGVENWRSTSAGEKTTIEYSRQAAEL